MLYMLAELGMIPVLKVRRSDRFPVAEDCRISGKLVLLTVPGTGRQLQVPTSYLGRALRCPETGTWFWVPTAEEIRGES
jgi:hypothetical protein